MLYYYISFVPHQNSGRKRVCQKYAKERKTLFGRRKL